MTALPRSIEQLKKDAKRLKRALGVPHAEALKRIATDQGFPSWELLLAQRNPSANRIPLLSLPVADPNSPGTRFMSERVFMLPVFLPIIGSTGTGKTVMMLKLARDLLNLGCDVCYVAPAEQSFARKLWPADAGAVQARDLARKVARFTIIDREALTKAGTHYLDAFGCIAPNAIVLLDDPFALPGGPSPISDKNQVDLSPLFERGCRVVASLQCLRDLTCLRLGKDADSAVEVARESDIALLGFTRDMSTDLAILDGFGFGSGVRDCLNVPSMPAPPDRPPSFGFWLVQNTRTDVAFVPPPYVDDKVPA